MKWNPQQFKILGIWFTLDLRDLEKLNYDEKFNEVKILFKIWAQRMITPIGKVAVLKSLVLSTLLHLWILLPDPPDKFITDLQMLCFQFIWNGKQDRISRKTVVKDTKQGGLNVPDVRNYIFALKLTWIRKFKSTGHKWKNVAVEMYPFLNDLEKRGASFVVERARNNLFWEHVFKAYKLICKTVSPCSSRELLAEPVLYNDNIKVGGKVITHTHLINKGIYCIKHFLTCNGEFLSHAAFNSKYNTNIDFLTFHSCVQSIRKYIRSTKIEVKDNFAFDLTVALNLVHSVHKGTKVYYNALTQNDNYPNCCAKWSEKLNDQIPWKTVFFKIHKIGEVKLRWLQMRIVHRILATNVMLEKMKVATSIKCTFCCNEKDSIRHIFLGV